MATRDVFSEDELAQLQGFPEPARAELIRYFTLGSADEAFVRKFRGQDNVMGVAVQLGTLPWLGFVPDDVAAAPAAVVARLSEKLDIPVGALRGYGAREQTRTDHLRRSRAVATRSRIFTMPGRTSMVCCVIRHRRPDLALVTYGDDSAVARHTISAMRGRRGQGEVGRRPDRFG